MEILIQILSDQLVVGAGRAVDIPVRLSAVIPDIRDDSLGEIGIAGLLYPSRSEK